MPANILRGMTIRLNAEKTADTHMTVVFIISDRKGESHALETRRGIAEYKEKIPE
jgi:hypothetical protein